MNNSSTIIVIAARGNSKGIKKKNLIKFCGKPLLYWTIIQAKKSKFKKNIYVSSEDEKILKFSRKLGVNTILCGLTGGAGGIFGSLPMLKFANGGRPPVGKPSIVGEKGPELFVPKRSGTIIPNDKLIQLIGNEHNNKLTFFSIQKLLNKHFIKS